MFTGNARKFVSAGQQRDTLVFGSELSSKAVQLTSKLSWEISVRLMLFADVIPVPAKKLEILCLCSNNLLSLKKRSPNLNLRGFK